MHHFLFYCLQVAVKLYSVCVSSCSCWNIYHENEVPEPDGLSQEREQSVRFYCKSPQMVVFKLNTFFFFLFPFSDSCLVCLGFLKGFTTPHIGHHSSFSLLSYTFSLLLAPHFALSRTLDSHWTLYCKNFFLPDGQLCPAALLLAVEGES